ncbi:2-methyl-6-phytyl-1,4-hydroquinone methyltransferase [Porphyridium purpureum]|uniref:2-methyl-6-phytyl-1,4-hydroquinone methyltransferase n=1 Tax=Porphyridium purpureum TaxID=35688 RepID=A0A5J4Z1W0_PORPP|nr:2-methyl-6-phytyl-1,4-hydroquinone methyltransferase [Porphyridium purpureum]|eukprot:POR5222..scf208_2
MGWSKWNRSRSTLSAEDVQGDMERQKRALSSISGMVGGGASMAFIGLAGAATGKLSADSSRRAGSSHARSVSTREKAFVASPQRQLGVRVRGARIAENKALVRMGVTLGTVPHALLAMVSATVPVMWKAVLALAVIVVLALIIKKDLDTPKRPYTGSFDGVGAEYDKWTMDGILEYYWGEHIHLGYYSKEEQAQKGGAFKKDFKQAKIDFTKQMLYWTGVKAPRRILDVGCGIGGTSRILAKEFPHAEVIGISLSSEQVQRATALAEKEGLDNVTFRLMDALHMDFDDDTFDLVWGCESGEHMPDKAAYVNEMTRVLAPQGTLAIATWCQRDTPPEFTQTEKDRLQYLYDEWSHPHFISYQEYMRIMQRTNVMGDVIGEDWNDVTLPSWRHSNWVGVVDPWPVIFKFNPALWYWVIREIVCLERMHRAFRDGLMQYGMIKGVKKVSSKAAAAISAAAASQST